MAVLLYGGIEFLVIDFPRTVLLVAAGAAVFVLVSEVEGRPHPKLVFVIGIERDLFWRNRCEEHRARFGFAADRHSKRIHDKQLVPVVILAVDESDKQS